MRLLVTLVGLALLALQTMPAHAREGAVLKTKHDTAKNAIGNIR